MPSPLALPLLPVAPALILFPVPLILVLPPRFLVRVVLVVMLPVVMLVLAVFPLLLAPLLIFLPMVVPVLCVVLFLRVPLGAFVPRLLLFHPPHLLGQPPLHLRKLLPHTFFFSAPPSTPLHSLQPLPTLLQQVLLPPQLLLHPASSLPGIPPLRPPSCCLGALGGVLSFTSGRRR